MNEGADFRQREKRREKIVSRKTELAKNTAILTVGKLCTQLISFFLLPLYTAVLSTEEFGIFDLLVTYTTLLFPLVNWQFDQGLFRFMLDVRGREKEQKELFSTLLIAGVVQSILYAGFFCAAEPFLTIEYAYYLLIYVIFHVFTALLQQFARGLGSNVKYTIASFISAASITICNVLALVVCKMGVRGLFVSSVMAQVFTLLYLIVATKCWRYISVKLVNWSVLKKVGSYSFPLIPNNLAWWVVNTSDRVVIVHFLGAAANGIYSVANKFPNVFINFYNILNLSWTETVSLHFNDEDRDEFLSETMTSLFKLFAAACFGIVAFMPFVFPIMVNDKYGDSYNHILILMYAMLFRVLVGLYSCVYIAEKKAKKIAYTSISAAMINLMVDLLLIHKIEVFAASFSTFIAFVSMFLIRYVDVNREICMKIKRHVAIGSAGMGIMLAVSYYSGNRPVQMVMLIVTILYAFVSNMDLVRSGIILIKNYRKK